MRGVRIFDLYNTINITIIFSMLPYFLSENSDFEEVKKKRSVADINKSAKDLPIDFFKVYCFKFF